MNYCTACLKKLSLEEIREKGNLCAVCLSLSQIKYRYTQDHPFILDNIEYFENNVEIDLTNRESMV